MNTDQYRVKSGQKVSLKDWITDDTGGYDKEDSKILLDKLEAELAEWQERLHAEGKQALLIVLQARDAGGKDGTVKHVFGAFNPNGVQVSNFKVPSEEELSHDFLWRIHAKAPRRGVIGVFNRSHYEDVLVTRVHNLIDDKTAKDRLGHIQNFEAMLIDSGTQVIKFYLHISPNEQRDRLQERLDDPSKHWKFSENDLAERVKWTQYTAAYEDALSTSTKDSPWYVIPADHKWFRNLLISRILLDRLKEMNPQYPTTGFDPKKVKIPKV
ncbi:polyphosphate kinase 2 family protein [Deinococcus sp. QL22]|uniref:polyphosphate kinase 2 family protein n=1 Tax=Deinococcus sp. QL22 TaxID=2939437 RepID=UPI002017EBC4|nr:polyphosphate kinase 2 family protein [Deinococcus sp. QL22]UQN07558.1 polyphosphate kinase 2 family protein [Deinococcus sp. QL22]